ncbi:MULTISPECIES: hypothetical protein [Halomonas]|nr:hypothetical protein [Halomonas salina]
MKRILISTLLAAALGASVSTMAMEREAPVITPSAVDRQDIGVEVIRQADAPLMLAVGDAWEARGQRLSQPLTPKRTRSMPRREVRDTNPWWR